MTNANLTLLDYVESGHPAIIYRTSEEVRALHECMSAARITNSKFLCWSATYGMHDATKTKNTPKIEFPFSQQEYTQILIDALNQGNNTPVIFCLLDFHHYMKNPEIMRTAKDVFQLAKERQVTYIFISESFEVPGDLKHEMVIFDMEPPSKSDLEKLVNYTVRLNECENISEEDVKKAADALSGLTLKEAENALMISVLKTKKLDLDIIYNIKRKTICQDNLLEYYKSDESMDNVGGMQEFKDYARERSFSAYSEEAKEYGLPYPKGVLLFGVPGCGKSLAAKALANMWQVPLIKLDLSKLFASLVGETESNTRKALQMAEAMAPCVLWLDEVDKAISGTASSGKTDSGVTSRMFGSILTWLQEKDTPVYVIATANNINLPPEFLRKGRFDEIFFVDLPNLEERRAICEIQVRKHKGKLENFDIEKLADASEDYNGAEIEECVVSAMYRAWNDGKRPYTTDDIISAMTQVTPASHGVAKETIGSLREWSKSHGIRNASSPMLISKVTTTNGNSRRVKRSATYMLDENQGGKDE